MRIKVDAKQNDNQERILQLAQQVLKSAHGRDIFYDPDGVTGNIPNSPATIIDVTLVDGELAIGIENNEYNSFMGSFKNKGIKRGLSPLCYVSFVKLISCRQAIERKLAKPY